MRPVFLATVALFASAPAAASAREWSGLSVGAAMGSVNTSLDLGGGPQDAGYDFSGLTLSYDHGFETPLGDFVAGVSYTGLGGSPGPHRGHPLGPHAEAEAGIYDMSTAAVRVGVPVGDFLPYASAGMMWTGVAFGVECETPGDQICGGGQNIGAGNDFTASAPLLSVGVDYAPRDWVVFGVEWSSSHLEPGVRSSEMETCTEGPVLFPDPANPLSPTTTRFCQPGGRGPTFAFTETDVSVFQVQLKLKISRWSDLWGD